MLYLSGGNDALSMVIPYNDPFYYSRRPTLAVPAGDGAADRHRLVAAIALGLHPRLTGLKTDLQRGPARADSAHRLRELEPLAFRGHRHLVDGGSRRTPQGTGWLGRYLDTLPSPVDPLVGWNTTGDTAARAAGETRSACRRFRVAQRLRVREPEQRRGSAVRARQRRRASPRTCRSISRIWRS